MGVPNMIMAIYIPGNCKQNILSGIKTEARELAIASVKDFWWLLV